MNCRELRKLLPAYLDGETSPSERQLVQSHLKTCERCQEQLQALDGLRGEVQQHFQSKAGAVSPPATAWSDLQAVLPTEPPRARGRTASIPLAGWLSGLRLSTQRLALVLVIGLILVAVAPPVWARLEPILVNWFSFSSPSGDNFMALGGFDAFTPYHATYLPEEFESGLLGSLTGQDIDAIEIGYDDFDGGFVTLLQSMGSGVAELPLGVDVEVGAERAVFIPDYASSAEELVGKRPEVSIVTNHDYATTNYLAWFLGEVKIEMFSNQPLAEMLKVAESLEPMQASEGGVPHQ